jgi:hypothetical protein
MQRTLKGAFSGDQAKVVDHGTDGWSQKAQEAENASVGSFACSRRRMWHGHPGAFPGLAAGFALRFSRLFAAIAGHEAMAGRRG